MTSAFFRVMICCSVITSFVGCQNSESKPSYADLVVIYNSEAEALDRLEKKREELLEKVKLITQPSRTDKAAEALKGLLKTAGDLKRQNEDILAEESNELLDLALENADRAEVIASRVIDAAAQPSEEQTLAKQEELISLRVELAELDKAIVEQEERVKRARKNRDLAEMQR